MVWKESYKVGVQLIDRQHKELFQRVSDFLLTLRSPVPWDDKVLKVNSTLEFMKDYVVTHFRDEEKLQKEVGYPRLETHRQIHRDMVHYISDVASQYETAGCDERMVQQFAGKLLAWLINHVTAEDQRIANFIKSKDVSGNE
ncbi:MAG: bacteriohemerythrin [Oscillospiraceae bacterium]